MSTRRKVLTALIAGWCLGTGAASAQAAVQSKTVDADQAFPLLKGFLSLPQSERSAINVTYFLKIKHGSFKDVALTLNDDDKPPVKLSIGPDGRITPLPSLTQLKGEAKVTVAGPDDMSPALRLRVISAQGASHDYDAAGLRIAQAQAMKAEKKLAGGLGLFVKLPILDRVYFPGAGSGMVILADGSQKPLPSSEKFSYYAQGTPYFVPADWPQAVKVHFNTAPGHAFIDEKAH